MLKPSSGTDTLCSSGSSGIYPHRFPKQQGFLWSWEGVYFCLPGENNMPNFWSPKRLFQLLLPIWVSLALWRQCHHDAETHSSPQFISGLSQHRASALSSLLIIYCILLADLIVFCPVLESCMDGFRKKSMCPDQQAFFPQRRGISKVPQFLVFICFL